jgi:hypothetical protein
MMWCKHLIIPYIKPTIYFYKLFAKTILTNFQRYVPYKAAIKPIMTDKTEESSAIVAVLGNLHNLVHLTDPHPSNPFPNAELSLPHTTSSTLPPILHPSNHFFSLVKTSKVPQSAPYAWDKHLQNRQVSLREFLGWVKKPDVKKTIKGGSLLQWAPSCAMTGIPAKAVLQLPTAKDTNALGAGRKIMELRAALEHRKKCPLTPYKAESWNRLLHLHNLHIKYPRLIKFLQKGFNAGIQKIYHTFTPPNRLSLDSHIEAYQEIIDRELHTGRYIKPMSQSEVKDLIGHFQSSPLSLVPKPSKVGKLHTVHNFSYSHLPTGLLSSINYTIDPDVYPCTWGTFGTISFIINNLFPGSQASIRDVAEAYHIIPYQLTLDSGLVLLSSYTDKIPTASILMTILDWHQLVRFMVKLLMLVLTFSGCKGLVLFQNGWMTIFPFGYLVSTSVFTMRNKACDMR